MIDGKYIIGRADIIDFPELNIFGIHAKIDTGAFTSSINCANIEVINEGGKEVISFSIPKRKKGEFYIENFKTHRFKLKKIRSSTGHAQMRYVIKTKIVLMNKLINTEFSLSDRSKMKYPVLLGRKLLANRFVVDVTKINISKEQNNSDK